MAYQTRKTVSIAEVVARDGHAWITDQVAASIDIVARARATAEPLP